jgi:hypothetical protein
MDQADAVISNAWRAAGWIVDRQELDLRGEWGSGMSRPGRPKKRITRYPSCTARICSPPRRGGGRWHVVVAHHDTVWRSPGPMTTHRGSPSLEVARLIGSDSLRRTVILAAPDPRRSASSATQLVRMLRGQRQVRAAIVFDPIGYMDPEPGARRFRPALSCFTRPGGAIARP